VHPDSWSELPLRSLWALSSPVVALDPDGHRAPEHQGPVLCNMLIRKNYTLPVLSFVSLFAFKVGE